MNPRTNYHGRDLPGARIRTLVVDDSPSMLKILAQTLEAAGRFELIGSATDGIKALHYASTLLPDLVLIDRHMPSLNGIQVTRHIKLGENPPVVIIVSSDNNSAAKATAELAGADGYVSKGANLRRQILGTLGKLFGPVCARTMATSEATA